MLGNVGKRASRTILRLKTPNPNTTSFKALQSQISQVNSSTSLAIASPKNTTFLPEIYKNKPNSLAITKDLAYISKQNRYEKEETSDNNQKENRKENSGFFNETQIKGIRLDTFISAILIAHFIYDNWNRLTDQDASDHDKAILIIKSLSTLIPIRSLVVFAKTLNTSVLKSIGLSGKLTSYLSDIEFIKKVSQSPIVSVLQKPSLEGLITKVNTLTFTPSRIIAYSLNKDAIEQQEISLTGDIKTSNIQAGEALTKQDIDKLDAAYSKAGISIAEKSTYISITSSTIKPVATLAKLKSIVGKVEQFIKSYKLMEPSITLHAEKMGRAVEELNRIENNIDHEKGNSDTLTPMNDLLIKFTHSIRNKFNLAPSEMLALEPAEKKELLISENLILKLNEIIQSTSPKTSKDLGPSK